VPTLTETIAFSEAENRLAEVTRFAKYPVDIRKKIAMVKSPNILILK